MKEDSLVRQNSLDLFKTIIKKLIKNKVKKDKRKGLFMVILFNLVNQDKRDR